MLKHIKTSRANKEVVSKLTRKLNLGAENIIARLALSYSLSRNNELSLVDIKDSKGKEYAKEVLFGEYIDYYVGMVALHYNLHVSNKDLPKYIKMHIDDGLDLLNSEFEDGANLDQFDFISSIMNSGFSEIMESE